MFSDAGPDVRWVGNERGVAFETSWSTLNLRGLYPGAPDYGTVAAGTPDGADWAPPEVDVSIRPGWFHHPAEDARVKSLDRLIEIYEQSVGRGANLLLNIPPDRRGLIPDADAARLRELGAAIAATYKDDLARRAHATSSQTRGRDAAFDAAHVNDGKPSTYWATDDSVMSGSIELTWPAPVEFSRVVLQDAIALGQRVERWTAEAYVDGAWTAIAEGTTIGHKRIARVRPTSTSRLRVTIAQSRACPVISGISVYR
jgi:alpha-L-fucosidase